MTLFGQTPRTPSSPTTAEIDERPVFRAAFCIWVHIGQL
jgi:hypothetical protein